MTNIINLFLYLFIIWLSFIYFSSNFSIFYIIIGFIVSLAISLASYRLGIIKKRRILLYLNIGFYKYFLKIYFLNLIPNIVCQIIVFLKNDNIKIREYKKKISSIENKKNFHLFESVINILPNHNILKIDRDEVNISVIETKFSKNIQENRIFSEFKDMNDDNIV